MKLILAILFGAFLPVCAFAMADSTPPVYGRPTLYGEYEITQSDIQRASGMYGDVPVMPQSAENKRAPKKSKPVAVKAKKNSKKSKSVKPQVKKQTKKVIQAQPIEPVADIVVPEKIDVVIPEQVAVVAPVEAEKTVSQLPAIPNEYATDIANKVSYKYDTNSYCIWQKPLYRGKLPDGLILMRGRPDLMSCTQ